MSQLYFYTPPRTDADGNPFPPLVFAYDGDTKVVFAHFYWKMVQEVYEIGPEYDDKGHPVFRHGREVIRRAKKTAWVLDEALNRAMAAKEIGAPTNAVHLTPGMLAHVKNRFPDLAQYLVSQRDVEKEQLKEIEVLRNAVGETDRLRQQLEDERARFSARMAEMETASKQLEADFAARKPKTPTKE